MKQLQRTLGNRRTSWGLALSAMALSGLLAGCGGGGGGTADLGPGPDPTPSAVSGAVADGYLRGATVCLDLNLNKLCDADEPTATTGEGGRYTIAGADLASLPEGTTAADYPILVLVPATAIDEDTLTAVGKAYVLAAPAGKPEFVSPMTTLVQNQLETNPVLTPAQAEQQLKTQLGLGETSSLFEDYVQPAVAQLAPEQAQAKAAELRKVHQVAQVVARSMAEMKAVVEQAAQTAGIDPALNRAAIVKLVTEEALTKLPTIIGLVEEAAGSFNADAAASQVGSIDTTAVATRIEEKSTVATKSSFARMLEGEGTFWLEHGMENGSSRFEYGNVRLPAGTQAPIEAHFLRGDGQWLADTSPQLPHALLTASGWQSYADGAANFTVVMNPVDGTAMLTHTGSGLQEQLSAIELDLAGKSHGAMAPQLQGKLLEPTQVFPAGAKGYKLTFVPLQDRYLVHAWSNDQGVDQNYVRYWNQTSGQEGVVTSLAELKNLFADGSVHYLDIGGGEGFSLVAQFAANGSLKLFKRSWNGSMTPELLARVGGWSETQVHGQALVQMIIPEFLRSMVWDDGSPFFVVKDGVVKRGSFQAMGSVSSDKDLNYNLLAFNSLSGNVNYNFQASPVNPGMP